MPPGNGVSISVGANTGPVNKAIAGVGQGLAKLAGTSKQLFGSGNAGQVNAYNRHLQNLDRNLERINQRMKTLQGTQAALLQQQKQLQQTGGSLGQHQLLQRAIVQNQRSMGLWSAKQLSAQTALQVAQGNRPAVGGGGGGTANFFAGQMQQAAGGIGGVVLKALGVAALAKGASAIAARVFTTALDEQKLFADLAPRMTLGGGTAMTSPKGWMNALRESSMPMGYSGIEGLKIAGAMSSGSNSRGLLSDTKASMQMARMFGIDAGGQASMLAEGGKLGGFVPGQAKRFAEMLAREIGVTGLGPRAQEVQEATLMLMHRQLSTSATSNVGAALAAQQVLAKTGLPGFQGAQGAGVLSNFQNAVTGSSDDASLGFLEATARDQMGITGYYNMRRLRDQGPLGNSKLFAGLFQEARQKAANPDAAKDIMSKEGGMTFTQAEQIYNSTHGYKDITTRNIESIKKRYMGANGLVDKGAAGAMNEPGNSFRVGEATISSLMGKMGTPMVQGIGSLVAKASTEVQKLMSIDTSTKGLWSLALGKDAVHLMPGKVATVPDGKGGFKQSGLEKNVINPVGKGLGRAWNWLTDQGEFSRHAAPRPPALPSTNGVQPVDPHAHPMKRSDAGHLHIHVSFDHTGMIHPHAKQQFAAAVEQSMSEIEQRRTRLNLHTRYPRA